MLCHAVSRLGYLASKRLMRLITSRLQPLPFQAQAVEQVLKTIHKQKLPIERVPIPRACIGTIPRQGRWKNICDEKSGWLKYLKKLLLKDKACTWAPKFLTMERPLPALALWRDPADGTGYWRRAVVLQYDSAGEKFEVQYEEFLGVGWTWNGLPAMPPFHSLASHSVWRRKLSPQNLVVGVG